MDRVKSFLAKYVEWVALGVGGLFLLWTIYANVLSQPVSVPLGKSSELTAPSQVDQKTWAEVGTRVAQMERPVQADPTLFQVPDYRGMSTSVLSLAKAPTDTYAVNYLPSRVQDAPSPTDGVKIANGDAPKVESLPVLPVIEQVVTSNGASNVGVGDPSNPSTDVSWVSTGGKISMGKLAAGFQKVKVPANFSTTMMLRVNLFRQEKLLDGSWGEATAISRPAIQVLPPMPNNGDPVADCTAYADFAKANISPIVHPDFYKVLQGDSWYYPGIPSPNVKQSTIVVDKFDPSTVSRRSLVPPEHLAEWDAYQKELLAKKAAEAAQKRTTQGGSGTTASPPNYGGTGAGTGRSTGTGGRGKGKGVVTDPDRPLTIADAGGATPGGSEFSGPFSGRNKPADPEPTPQPAAAATGAQTPSATDTTASLLTVPNPSPFDPARQADLFVWAHDDTAQAGKTYRYQLSYVVYNPVYNTVNVCNPPALAAQFSITSDRSAWSEPVAVEADADFYAVGLTTSGAQGVKFDIFRWQKGSWKTVQVVVRPGDVIGAVDKATGIDFGTGWTLLDVRQSSRVEENAPSILLVSSNGTLLRRDVATDTHKSDYREHQDQVKTGADKTSGTSPAAAASPPGMGPKY